MVGQKKDMNSQTARGRLLEFIYSKKIHITLLSCMVVFVATYLLILPAITLDQDEAEQQGGIDVPQQTEQAVTQEDADGLLSFTGKGYTITADGKDLPDDAELVAEEILQGDQPYESLYEDALAAVGDADDFAFAKFYDISLMSEGEAIEPENPMDVTISFNKGFKADDADNIRVVHFAVDEETGETEAKVLDPDLVDTQIKSGRVKETTFAADSFSVYAVVYTVDFHWEVDGKKYDFSLPGGGYVSFEALMEVLNIAEKDEQVDEAEAIDASTLNDIQISKETKQFVADVESVEFSDPSLVWIGKIDDETTVGALKEANELECQYSATLTEEQIEEINAQTVETGDWALISLQAFDTEETLTVTMRDGDVFIINVTDLQENPFGLDGKSFKIVNNSNAMTANVASEIWGVGRMLNPTNNLANGETWTFEYTGSGTHFLLRDSRGQYLLMIPRNVANTNPGLVEGLQFTTDKTLAETYPIVVKEVIDRNGKRGYALLDSTSGHCLSYDYNKFYLDDVDFEANKTEPRYCMELRDPSSTSKPGLVGTADTRSEGITINMFDYYAIRDGNDVLDEEANRYYHASGNVGNNNQYNIGINQNHALKFTSHGQSPRENNTTYSTSINSYSDPALNNNQYVAVQGIVKSALDENGFPVLTTNNESLKYLFDTNSIDNAKTAYNDLNHFFIKDEKGYYRYNSNENYAFYDTSSNNTERNFDIYAGTFNEEGTTGNEAVGFFPFNDYDSYYNCIHGGYPGNPGSFQYYGPHNGAYSNKIGHYNHQFGMSLEANFVMTPDGKYLGDDIVFDFSGDDDLWVFVDGVLVLDIGGVHNPVSGNINFNSGAVTVRDEVHNSDPNQMVINGGQAGPKTIKEAFERVTGKEWDDSPYTRHTLKVFYMERGGMYSNLAISFNLPVYKTITVEKELEGLTKSQLQKYNDEYFYYQVEVNGKPYTGPYGVLTRPATQAELDSWVPEYKTLADGTQEYVGGHWTDPNHTNTETINKFGELVKWHIDVEDGLVRVKPGWYFTIEELGQNDTFSVAELYGYDSRYVFHDGQENDTQTPDLMDPFLSPTAEYTYKDIEEQSHKEALPLDEEENVYDRKAWRSDTKNLQYSDWVKFRNTIPTKLKVQKVWSDDGQEGVDHTGQKIEYKIYRIPYRMIDDPDNEGEKIRVDYPVQEVTSELVPTMEGFTGELTYSSNEDMRWKETVSQLPRVGTYTPAGEEEPVKVLYEYYVTEETAVDGYKYSIEGGEITEGEGEGDYSYTITNEPLSPTDQETQIDIQKEWKNADGSNDTSLHKDDSIVFKVTQKKFKAEVKYQNNGQTYTKELYPITINLVDKNGNNGGSRATHTTVVYVPEGASFVMDPRYNDPQNQNTGQHVVSAGGIAPASNSYQTITHANTSGPSSTYYYPEAKFKIDNVNSAKEVTLWLYDGYDIWVNLYDREHPTVNLLDKDKPNEGLGYRRWACELSSNQGIIWDLDEMMQEVLSGGADTTTGDPTPPEPVETHYPQYTMTLTNSEDGLPTVITRGENAPGYGVGDGEVAWKGSVTNLPLYEYKGTDGKAYIYTYEVAEAAIGSNTVITANSPNGWNGQTSSYLVKWEQNTQTGLWTLTNQLKPSINVSIHKVDKSNLEAGTPLLAGAKFKLIKYTQLTPTKIKDTSWGTDGVSEVVSDNPNAPGIFSFRELDAGYYEIVEDEYPAGYIQATTNPIFQVRANSEAHAMEVVLVDANGADITGNATDMVKVENGTITVGNEPGAALPNSGGPGTTWIYLLGCLLFIGCSVLLVARRRMEH